MITLGTLALATRNITNNASLFTGSLSAPCADAQLELFFGADAAPIGNLTVFVEDVNGYLYGFATDTFTREAETYAIIRLALPAGGHIVRLDSSSASDTAVQCSAALRDVSPDAATTTTWTGLFPPREMSGDRIGFSHPDNGTFYYLVNNAADATPTTFTGTSSGSTRSVLRSTVATDVADGFTVLTVYKQVGGSVVHANDTPVGAILVNKTAGTVTERLLTQTELDAIRVVSVDATEVADRYTFKYPRNGSGTTATNRITVRTDYAGPIAFDLSSVIYNGSTIASITSVTASGGVTPGNNRVHVSRRMVLTTLSSVATPGTYTLTLVCTTADSQTVKVTGTIVVQ